LPRAGAAVHEFQVRSGPKTRRPAVGTLFLRVFITMFVIIDPVGNVPMFLILTRDRERRALVALQAVVAAGLLVLGFGLFGTGVKAGRKG
jgi:hypothetical protein